MQKLFENYIQSISSKFAYVETSEMGYRTDFEILIKEIFESINVKRIDHDARAKQGNKPDFVVLKYYQGSESAPFSGVRKYPILRDNK